MRSNVLADRLLSVDEVAEYLGYRSRTTIYAKIRDEGLPFERIGARYRFRSSDVDRWVKRQTERAAAADDRDMGTIPSDGRRNGQD